MQKENMSAVFFRTVEDKEILFIDKSQHGDCYTFCNLYIDYYTFCNLCVYFITELLRCYRYMYHVQFNFWLCFNVCYQTTTVISSWDDQVLCYEMALVFCTVKADMYTSTLGCCIPSPSIPPFIYFFSLPKVRSFVDSVIETPAGNSFALSCIKHIGMGGTFPATAKFQDSGFC